MNLYELVNEELKRMTAERDFWLKVAFESLNEQNKHRSVIPCCDRKFAIDKYKEIGTEIFKVREKIFGQFEDYDAKIQEKVAELALTGKTNG